MPARTCGLGRLRIHSRPPYRTYWLSLLCWLGLAVNLCGCPSPTLFDTLRPPKGTERQQIRWMRLSFYQLYQFEQKRQNGGDLLRRFIKKYPKIAYKTFRLNAKAVEQRRISGQKLRNLERFYLLMNVLIRESISVPRTRATPPSS